MIINLISLKKINQTETINKRVKIALSSHRLG